MNPYKERVFKNYEEINLEFTILGSSIRGKGFPEVSNALCIS